MPRIGLSLCLALAIVIAGVMRSALATWEEAPKFDFQLDDLKGQGDVQMEELAERPLVVHVWAPDCPMCQRNMPFFKSVVSKVDLEQVNVVACSMRDRTETSDYVKQHQLEFPVLFKGHSQDYISDSFTDDGWPTSFVFAPGGELIGTCDAEGAAYEKQMLELIARAVAKVKPKAPAKEVRRW